VSKEQQGACMGLMVLARSLAYVIDADSRTTFEEKAKVITVLGKHVARGEISKYELQGLTDDAFNHAGVVSVDHFLDEITPDLTPAQKISLVINLYDAMLVDGQVATGERSIVDKFIAAFEIGRNTIRALREVIILKNDTGVFADARHPFNEPSFQLNLQLINAFEAETPPELKFKPRDKKK
jgi:hypothetical protein